MAWQHCTMSHKSQRPTRLSFSTSVALVLVMTLHLYAPLVSAANMSSCQTACDEYDSNEDLTPHRQDWIEGTYDFNLEDTSTIRLDLVWAIREFNRTALGLDSIPAVQLALANDGLDSKDGAPADLIRDQFDTELPNSPGVRVQDQLITEIDKAIEDSVESGFGSASSPMTGYVGTYTNGGVTVQCSTDEMSDASDEGASTNNAFEPPICIQSSVDITLSPDSFNLVSNTNLELERAYQGLLVMGTEVTTMFDLVGLPGHKSSYSFNPPEYASIKSVDANGVRAARTGPPAYFAGEWEIDHRNAGENDGDLALPIEVEMEHRNRTGTSTVVIPSDEKALDLQIRLDLRDESSATLDFIVALHYLDQDTMSDWGISMMSVADRATMNQVTSDGIRLAYHNDIVDLSNITSQFPVDTIAEGISSTVAGMETIQMNPMSWVSESTGGEGIVGPEGGLNFTHSSGCTEIVPPNKPLYYCVQGEKAMSYEHPVYLRATSQPFSMRLLDIMKENNDNEDVADVLDVLTTEDFRRVMNAGIEFQSAMDSDFLADIVPDDLPPSELTLEIILPAWIQTMDGSDRITLKDSLDGNDEMEISFSGVNQYDWRNVIKNQNGDIACYSNQSTCTTNVGGLDAMEFDFNEWDRSVSVEFGLDASVALHRIGIPQDRIPTYENHSISMEAIPSDLIRLGIDISSRLESPINRTLEFSEYCTTEMMESMPVCGENITFEFSSQGITEFVARFGEVLTDFIHQTIAYYLDTHSTQIKSVDLDAFVIDFSIGGIDAPDYVVSDNEGIYLSMKIPKVRFKLEVDGNLAEMWTGNFESAEYTLTTNAVQNLILGPMTSMVDSFSHALTSGIFSIFSLSGVNIPPERVTVPFFLTNSTVNEEFDLGWTGPFTVTMPKGLEFSYLNSSAGNIEIGEVDGRQQITYHVPYGEFEDDITFKFKVTWYFFFIQLWKYLGIVAILLVLAIRRRKKRKLRKQKVRNAAKAHSAHKVSINPTEFADLSGFHSKGIHGDMEVLKDYQEDTIPPRPPTSSGLGDGRFD